MIGAGPALVLALSLFGCDRCHGNQAFGASCAAPTVCAGGWAGGFGCGLGGGCGSWGQDCHNRCYDRHHCLNGMPQHLPYLNPYKGYYFFRPYNYTMIGEQQQVIASLGGNPRSPYDNRFFERIYRDVESMPSATPTPSPLPAPLPLVPLRPE